MKNLWAAWRRDFILGPKESGCVFCKRLKRSSDRNNLILFRGKRSFVIMNKYPYNGGHLLVCPNKHKNDINSLTFNESCDIFNLSRSCIKILDNVMPVDGFNLGINIGATAGAGIEEHLHIHVVPRFKGDTSFISVLNDIKVQSIPILEIYDMLKPGFDRLRGKF